MNLREFKKKALEDPEFKKVYYTYDPAMDTGLDVMEARLRRHLTQKQLAEKVGTKQSSIARLEDGDSLPSLRFLKKIAEALGTELIPPAFASLVEAHRKEESEEQVGKAKNLTRKSIVEDYHDSYLQQLKQFKGDLQLYEKENRGYKKTRKKKYEKTNKKRKQMFT